MTTPRGATNAGGSGDPIRRTVRVIDPRGLHPRLILPFTNAAKGFTSTVTVWNGDLRADGRNFIDLMLLVVFPGSEVVLEVDGPDAAIAMETLAAILAAPSGEDYSI